MFTGILARRTLCDSLLFALQIFFGFLVVGLPALVFQRLLVYGIPYSYIPNLIFYMIPECIQNLLPLSLMLGVIITFARMGEEKEIMILKASGIQPTRLIYPVLAMAFLISFVAWYFNDISPICRERGIRSVLLNGAEKIVNGMLKTNGEINTRQIRITADSVENGYLHGVSIHYMSSPTSTPVDIEAETARIETDKERREFLIELSNCLFRSGDASGASYRKKDYYPIPIEAFLAGDAASNITNAPMLQMIKELSILKKNIKETQENIAGDTATILLTGEYEMYNTDVINTNRSNLKEYTNTYKKAILEPYRRFTFGFSCLCLVTFGAPLAIYCNYKKITIYWNFLISSGITILLFLVLFMMWLNLGKQGVTPPWMICFADIIPLVLGLLMIRFISNK